MVLEFNLRARESRACLGLAAMTSRCVCDRDGNAGHSIFNEHRQAPRNHPHQGCSWSCKYLVPGHRPDRCRSAYGNVAGDAGPSTLHRASSCALEQWLRAATKVNIVQYTTFDAIFDVNDQTKGIKMNKRLRCCDHKRRMYHRPPTTA